MRTLGESVSNDTTPLSNIIIELDRHGLWYTYEGLKSTAQKVFQCNQRGTRVGDTLGHVNLGRLHLTVNIFDPPSSPVTTVTTTTTTTITIIVIVITNIIIIPPEP